MMPMLGLLMGGFELLFLLMFGCLGLVGTVFWIWMLIDCATKETDRDNTKLVWILIIIFTHWIGALIYLLVRRPKRIAELGH